ncbi:hypothetical protein PpBr36_02023 [Pyricularia pennisetigena]|uniref:hypothetical protein n=1 Tax=Pyricularia pennisetigena TaxID=1578925 RepID=UPI00115067EC|nr:hypothetical protein PpBr36_02023 [Pyricularia pennisetigena]TLS28029.1 hypothetical protein PpBr36_02023 [Pyricularia pennisetigena]
MRFTTYLTSAIFGMAAVVCAMPAGHPDSAPFTTPISERDVAGADWGSALVARGTGSDPIIDARDAGDVARTLDKRAKEDRVNVIDKTGAKSVRGGKMNKEQIEVWYPAARQAAVSFGVKQVTIIYRPHDGASTSSSDPREHITVRFPTNSGLFHVYEDGTYSTPPPAQGKKTKAKSGSRVQPITTSDLEDGAEIA